MTLLPWATNPRYWSFKGSPRLFLGGSDQDNLFQYPNWLDPGGSLASHLDALAAVGGDWVRCTLSARDSAVSSTDRYPWTYNAGTGLYDLDTFNVNYFDRLNTLLTLCEARDIVVQIELFDGFDWRDNADPGPYHWTDHPMNPLNNDEYTEASSGVPEEWTQVPSAGWNPVHTAVYDSTLTDPATIKGYLDAFVDRVLDETLLFDNVLYVDGNEHSNPTAWSVYWADFVKARAALEPKTVYFGSMVDQRPQDDAANDPWWALVPDDLDFHDISQITHNDDDEPDSWDQALGVLAKTDDPVRPLNITKVYHPSSRSQASDGDGWKMGWRTFPRMVFAGMASVRFHRRSQNSSGGPLGLSTQAQARIKACREADDVFGFVHSTLATGLISSATTEVRCREIDGEKVAVLFIGDGSCDVDLTGMPAALTVQWWNTHSGNYHAVESVSGGGTVGLSTPSGGNADSDWIAIISEDPEEPSEPNPEDPEDPPQPPDAPDPEDPPPPWEVSTAGKAWAFVLDGHVFYVLNDVDCMTYVCDMTTGQWHHWYTGPTPGQWNMYRGLMWNGRVIAGDGATGKVWELAPESMLDEETMPIQRVVTAFAPLRGRGSVRQGSLRVTASMGEPSLVGSKVLLRFTDDEGESWSVVHERALDVDAFGQVLRYRSLGRIRAPGRIWEVSDKGGLVRIEGVDSDTEGE